MLFRLSLSVAILLAGCVAEPSVSAARQEVTAGVAAECALLERAYTATQAAGQPAFADIVAGCPGREGLAEQMGRTENAAAFTRASSAPVPSTANSRTGRILFQRMIARGVPVSIATQMAATPEFAAAVAAQTR